MHCDMPLAANASSMSWRFLLLSGPLIFWTVVHPDIEMEDDVKDLLRGYKELAALLLQEPDPWPG